MQHLADFKELIKQAKFIKITPLVKECGFKISEFNKIVKAEETMGTRTAILMNTAQAPEAVIELLRMTSKRLLGHVLDVEEGRTYKESDDKFFKKLPRQLKEEDLAFLGDKLKDVVDMLRRVQFALSRSVTVEEIPEAQEEVNVESEPNMEAGEVQQEVKPAPALDIASKLRGIQPLKAESE